MSVRMGMEAKLATLPAPKKADCEVDDDQADRGLRPLLHPLGQKGVQEDDG